MNQKHFTPPTSPAEQRPTAERRDGIDEALRAREQQRLEELRRLLLGRRNYDPLRGLA